MEPSGDEYVLLSKPEVFVHKIPPRPSTGHRAENWNQCIWKGKVQISSTGTTCTVKLLDSETNKMFASCPVPIQYDRVIERTVDSSRYFALKVSDGQGRHTFLGIGFENRNDAFDFNCTLSDFSRRAASDVEIEQRKTSKAAVPAVDYRLKEGEKVLVALKGVVKRNKPKVTGETNDFIGLIEPPPTTSETRLSGGSLPQKGNCEGVEEDDFNDFKSNVDKMWGSDLEKRTGDFCEESGATGDEAGNPCKGQEEPPTSPAAHSGTVSSPENIKNERNGIGNNSETTKTDYFDTPTPFPE